MRRRRRRRRRTTTRRPDETAAPRRHQIPRDCSCLPIATPSVLTWVAASCGAGRGAESLIAVFVGTGIGSGAVVDGILLRGAGNAAGELGHTQVVPDGVPCACGQRGCIEAYASGRGFARRLETALAAGTETRLARETEGNASRVTAALVARAAVEGDAFARTLWDDAERY